ncbi:Trk K+ transport system NAD-binding subunit [Catenulispora sp. GP43]
MSDHPSERPVREGGGSRYRPVMDGSKVLVIGGLDTARRACDALTRRGHAVVHLPEPTEAGLRTALGPDVGAVAIVVRGDVVALRYALLVEHLRPSIRLVVTVFDRTVADQLVRAIPNCRVTSPADIAVPVLTAACLNDRLAATDTSEPVPPAVAETPEGDANTLIWQHRPSRIRRVARALAGQVRSHDNASQMLLVGLVGLLAALTAEWLMAARVLHQDGPEALYTAARLVSTVGMVENGRAPGWYLVVSSAGMMLTITFAALFTAGIVERSLSVRSAGIIGARTVPRSGHVVVVGLGQVGLRLCLALRRLGVPVVAVERDPQAANLRLAKAARIPVLIAHAEDRSVLDRLRLPKARALAAMGAEELDNVEVAIAALAISPDLRVVLRAGDNDVITETRSLFHIGAVCDISAMTALSVADAVIAENSAAPVGVRSDAALGRCAC